MEKPFIDGALEVNFIRIGKMQNARGRQYMQVVMVMVIEIETAPADKEKEKRIKSNGAISFCVQACRLKPW
jgi:hypothetical protein